MTKAAKAFEVARCMKAAAAIEAELRELATGMTEAQFHAPPRNGGWSVGYCIEHLVLTGRAFLPKWDAALQSGMNREEENAGGFPYAWWQQRILECAENPTRLKLKTSSPFVPYARYSIEETIGRFLGMHQEFIRRVTSSRGLDAKRTKVQSPFVSWVWYALGFSFDFALAHERRHLGQAWMVRRQFIDARVPSARACFWIGEKP
jgi:hypothetical protein